MLRIDNNLLQEVGLGGLPDSDKNSLLRHIYETLEMRVGIRLADQMTNEQLDEFEHYFEAKDDAGAFKWLETNFPNYKDIVQQEFEKLKAEVAQSAPQILSSSSGGIQSGQAQPVNPQPPMQQPPVDPYATQQYATPAPVSQTPPPPPPSLPGDINMPSQPSQFTPYGTPNPGSVPPPDYTGNPMPPSAPQPPVPPLPNQQPPAGPGNPGSQF